MRLEPLQMRHAAELYEASRDPDLWTYKLIRQPRSLAEMEQVIASALQSQEAGACLPFFIIDLARGCAGSYRHSVYYSIIESEWPRIKVELEAKMQRQVVNPSNRASSANITQASVPCSMCGIGISSHTRQNLS